MAQVGASHSIVSVSDWFNFGFIYFLELFLEINQIGRNNERAENNEIRKNQDLVQNLRKIALRINAKLY